MLRVEVHRIFFINVFSDHNSVQVQLPAAMKAELLTQGLVRRKVISLSASILKSPLVSKPISTSQCRERFS